METVKVELTAGSMLRVNGPLSATVLRGNVMVLGAIYGRGEGFEIAKYRTYTIKALDDTMLSLTLYPEASIEPATPEEEVIDKWVSAVDSLLRKGCQGFMVLGPTDAGKSSLAALIANRALLRGLKPAIVDADIGQADIGPPGFISAATVNKRILWLRELRAEATRLVGSITPYRSERRIVAAAVELGLRIGSKADILVIDTDGWLEGPQSIEYKADIARFLGLDSVIAIGVPNDTANMIHDMFSWMPCGVTILPSPSRKRVRSREDRRELRAEAYKRYLARGYELELDATIVPVQGSCILNGKPLDDALVKAISEALGAKVYAGSRIGDTYYIAVEGQVDLSSVEKLEKSIGGQIVLVDTSTTRNIVASIITGSKKEVPALVLSIDYERRRIRVRVPVEVDASDVKLVLLSSIRLKEDYTEAGKPAKCIA